MGVHVMTSTIGGCLLVLAPPPHTAAPRARAAALTRARATLHGLRPRAPAAGAEHTRSHARVRYNCENTSHLQFLSDTEIPIYAQNLLHNTK